MDRIGKSTLIRASIAFRRHLGVALIVIVLTTALVGPLPASQAHPSDTIPVTTTEDEWDSGPDCSLREAVQAANKDDAFGGCPAGSGADVIELPAGTYTLTRAGNQDDLNASGDLDLDSDITINGAGQTTTIIDADGRDRVLHILDAHTVTLNDLTITGGHAPDGAPGANGVGAGAAGGAGNPGAHGGGILNEGSLTLSRCTIRDCRAGNGGAGGKGQAGQDGQSPGEAGGAGGEGGKGGYGGGIYSKGLLALDACTLQGNQAGQGGKGGAGAPGGKGAAGNSVDRDGAAGGPGGVGGLGGVGGNGGALNVTHAGGERGLSLTDSILRENFSGEGASGGVGGEGGEGGKGYESALTGEGGAGGIGGEGGDGSDGGLGGGIWILPGLTVTGSLITTNLCGAGGPGGTGGAGGKGGDGGNGVGFGIDGSDAGDGGEGGSAGYGGYGGHGGGIFAVAAVTVTLTTVSMNQAGDSGQGAIGGRGGQGGRGGHGTAIGGQGGTGGDGGKGGSGGSGRRGGSGGGILQDSSLESALLVSDSTVLRNTTGQGGAGGQGGQGGNAGFGGDGAGPDGQNGNGGGGGWGGDGGWGGGILVSDGRPSSVIESCTISGNSTGDGGRGGDGGTSGAAEGFSGGDGGRGGLGGFGGHGGGLHWAWGLLDLVNSTLSGNHAGSGGNGGSGGVGLGSDGAGGQGGSAGRGGGAYAASDARVRAANCTIVDNQADGAGGQGGTGSPPGAAQFGGRGGGIWTTGTFSMTHTILASNGAAHSGPDCQGDLDSEDFNLIGSVQDCTVVNPGHDIVGVGPDLLPLADNGGDTETHALLPTSLALDGGDMVCYDPEGAPVTLDQRGAIRPVDGDGSGESVCDIGAVEMQGSFGLTVTVVGEGEVDSEPAGIDCGGDCGEDYWDSTVVTLTATAHTGSSFVSWSGDCEGADPVCVVRMYASRQVMATYELDLSVVYLPLVRK